MCIPPPWLSSTKDLGGSTERDENGVGGSGEKESETDMDWEGGGAAELSGPPHLRGPGVIFPSRQLRLRLFLRGSCHQADLSLLLALETCVVLAISSISSVS